MEHQLFNFSWCQLHFPFFNEFSEWWNKKLKRFTIIAEKRTENLIDNKQFDGQSYEFESKLWKEIETQLDDANAGIAYILEV